MRGAPALAAAPAARAGPAEPRAWRLAWGATVFLGLSAAAILALARLVPDFARSQVVAPSAGLLAWAAALMLALWACDAWRYVYLARGLGVELDLRGGLALMFVFHTASLLTPGSAGGQPAMVWWLLRRGVSADRAVALAVLKPLLALGVVAMGAGLALGLAPLPPTGLVALAWPGVAFFLLVAALVAAILAWPATTARWLARPLRGVRGGRLAEVVERSARTVGSVRDRGPAFILANLALTALWYALGLALLGLVVIAASGERPSAGLVAHLAIFRALALFAPTPGAAGVAEGGIYWLFSPAHALTIMACYRVFFSYIEILVGLVLVARGLAAGRATGGGA